jgi:hypothetical protein
MAENSSHAPGSLDSSKDNRAVRQRAQMAEGGVPMQGASFGVGPLPGTKRLPMNQGIKEGHLKDGERAGGPSISMGEGSMDATRHSDHGPHGHTSRHAPRP